MAAPHHWNRVRAVRSSSLGVGDVLDLDARERADHLQADGHSGDLGPVLINEHQRPVAQFAFALFPVTRQIELRQRVAAVGDDTKVTSCENAGTLQRQRLRAAECLPPDAAARHAILQQVRLRAVETRTPSPMTLGSQMT